MVFINPYNFVPLPDEVERRRPEGHDRVASDNLTGAIDVDYTTRSPLLIGVGGGHGGDEFAFTLSGGHAVLPGSSFHGSVRSMFEALTNSCLRKVDLDYAPSHRQSLSNDDIRDLKLVVVKTTRGDAPADVEILKDVVWVRAHQFAAGPPRTGDRIEDAFPTGGTPWRAEAAAGVTVSTGSGRRVVLVSDSRAKRAGPYFATGLPSGTTATVGSSAWAAYRRAAQGCDDDGREAEWIGVGAAGEPEPGPGEPVLGYRRNQILSPLAGQPYWAKIETVDAEPTVVEIRPAQVWRFAAKAEEVSVRTRLGPVTLGSAHPCGMDDNWQDEDGNTVLCPACRTFGSSEEQRPGSRDDRSDRVADQRAYRGHVFVGDLAVDSTVNIDHLPSVELAPLGSPKPSAGQFYLDASGVSAQGRMHPGGGDIHSPSRALSTWGSMLDRPAPRGVRGRKFYWASAGGTPDRSVKRDHHNETQLRTVKLIPTGTVLRGSVQFSNLTPKQLAQLLVSLDPKVGLGDDAVLRVGGGKPFGYGSIATQTMSVTAWTGAGRWTGADPTHVDPTTWVATHLGDLMEQHPILAKLSTLDAVGGAGARIWYPTGAGQPPAESYDEGWDFWGKSSGRDPRLPGNGSHPLQPLAPADADQVTNG